MIRVPEPAPGLLRAAVVPLSGAGMAWGMLDASKAGIGLVCLGLLFALVLTASPRRALLETWLAVTVYDLILLRWFAAAIIEYTQLSPWLAAGAVVAPSIILGAEAGAVAWVAARWTRMRGPMVGALALAAMWVGLEIFRGIFPFPFPWGTVSALLAEDRYWQGVARWIGSPGVSLLGCLMASFLGLALGSGRLRARIRERMVALALLLLLVALAVGLGLWSPTLPGARQVMVGVVQGSLARDADDRDRLSVYEELTRQAASEGAEIVIWPESAVRYRVDRHPGFLSRLESLASSLGVDLIVGSVTEAREGGVHNSAALIRHDTGLLTISSKRWLVPFGEYLPWRPLFGNMPALAAEAGDFLPDEQIVIHPATEARVGVLICYEAVFDSAARALAESGADLLVNLTNDSWFGWTSGPRQHLRHAWLRAAETGRPLARAANSGISAIIDGDGRGLGELPLGVRGTLVRRVSLPRGLPWGVGVGRVLRWACATLSLLLLAGAFSLGRGFSSGEEDGEGDA